MLKSIKYAIINTETIINIIRESFNSPFQSTMGEKFLSIGNGFSSDKKFVYAYDKQTINDFFSDFHRTKSKRINEKYNQIFDNKLVAERLLSPFVSVPKSYFMLIKGKVISLSDSSPYYDQMSDLLKFIKEKKSMVLKPVYGGGGAGVQVIHYKEKINKFSINNELNSDIQLINHLKTLNNVLLTDFVSQSQYANNLYSESTNTIRILTMIDPETQEPFIAAAAQRVGTEHTKPTDNFGGGKGGISILIDTDTGELTHAVTIDTDGNKVELTNHPETGNDIIGFKVPHWDFVKKELVSTIKQNPFLQYVGWDVTITNEGFTVIEINSYSGLAVLQAHRPLKDFDSRIIPFYEHHQIL